MMTADVREIAGKLEKVVAENATTTQTCKKSLEVGNAAALLEALRKIHLIATTNINECACDDSDRIICKLADEALSKPPRNCDRFDNADEAKKAIHGQYPLHIRPQDERDAVIDWLFAEAKGETDEQ